jgi:hypothetical protein
VNNVDLRPRAQLSRAAQLLPTTAAVILVALVVALSSIDRTTLGDAVALPAPAVSQPGIGSFEVSQVVLRLPDGTASAALEDTAVARQFAALLPLHLTLRDPMGQAKSGRLTAPLAVAATARTIDPEVAGLYYWPPSGDIAIVYDNLGQTVPPPGLVRLGTVTSGLAIIATAGNRFDASVERPQ